MAHKHPKARTTLTNKWLGGGGGFSRAPPSLAKNELCPSTFCVLKGSQQPSHPLATIARNEKGVPLSRHPLVIDCALFLCEVRLLNVVHNRIHVGIPAGIDCGHE